MPTKPRTPATPAPRMAVGAAAPPVEEDDPAVALEAEVLADVPVLVLPPVEVVVELLYLPVVEAVVLPEEPVVRGTLALTPVGASSSLRK